MLVKLNIPDLVVQNLTDSDDDEERKTAILTELAKISLFESAKEKALNRNKTKLQQELNRKRAEEQQKINEEFEALEWD